MRGSSFSEGGCGGRKRVIFLLIACVAVYLPLPSLSDCTFETQRVLPDHWSVAPTQPKHGPVCCGVVDVCNVWVNVPVITTL